MFRVDLTKSQIRSMSYSDGIRKTSKLTQVLPTFSHLNITRDNFENKKLPVEPECL